MIVGIHHIGIGVADLAVAEAFYRDLAGMRVLDSNESDAIRPSQIGSASHAILAGRNAFLELYETDVGEQGIWSAPPVHRPGIRHFCVQNHDCAMLAQYVKLRDGSLIADPLDLGTGNQYAYARDPEGNIVEIEGLPYAPQGEPTWLAHVAMVVRSMDLQAHFYAGLFERELPSRMQVGPGPQYDRMGGLQGAILEGAWHQSGNILLEMWQFHAPEYDGPQPATEPLSRGIGHLALQSSDLENDLERLLALGGKWNGLSYDNPVTRGGFGRDPEGNVIELVEFKIETSALALASLDEPEICARIEAGRKAA